jgi:hypothetical protein
MPGVPAWQRNYYEQIIRIEKAWDAISEYSSQRQQDPENPDLIG